MNTYTITLTESEWSLMLQCLHESQADIHQRNRLWIKIHDTEPDGTHTCGECAHLKHLNPKKDSYNKEAYAREPWGYCHVYEASPEFQRMVENHCYGTGWQHAPGRALNCPACEQFKPNEK